MKIVHSFYYVFDKIEDHIRAALARHPFIYTFIGGTCVVLFWRGVWHTADILEKATYVGSILFSPVGSIVVSVLILLATGLFVSVFIGDSIIMSGLRREKKIIEKTIDDVTTEKGEIEQVLVLLGDMKKELELLEHKARKRCEEK